MARSLITVCESGCHYTTITEALNIATSPGDIVEIQDSRIYRENIFWNANGSSDNYIILQAQSGCTPIIMDYIWLIGSYQQLGAGPGYGTITVSSDNSSWIDGAVSMGSSGHHNIVRYTNIIDVRNGVGIYISDNSHNNLIENIIMDNIHYANGAAGTGASGIRIRGYQNIIQNCTLYTVSHDNIGIEASSAHNNKIINNYFNNKWGHGIAFSQYSGGYSSYTLIEGNTFENIASLAESNGKNCIQISGANHITIRKNVFIRPYHRAFEISCYSSGTAANEDVWIYNNTFYNIGWQGITQATAGVVQHNVGPYTSEGKINNIKWYNNILEKVGQNQTQGQGYWEDPFYAVWILAYYAGNDAGCGESGLINNDWNGNILKNNCIRVYYSGAYHTDYDHTIYYMGAGGSNCDVWYSAIGVNGIGSASGNIVDDPLFNNPEGGDFSLQQSSPCIDSGIVVYDSNATIGGWNQLTYSGSAPDIGAYEYQQGGVKEDSTIQVYPNPCKVYMGETFIIFDNLNVGNIIKVFDISGKIIHNSENITSDTYIWNVNNMSSGIYFYKIAGSNKASGKIVIIR